MRRIFYYIPFSIFERPLMSGVEEYIKALKTKKAMNLNVSSLFCSGIEN